MGICLRLVFWPIGMLFLAMVCLAVRFSAGPVSVPVPESALDALMARAAPGWRLQSSGAEFDLMGKDGLTGLKLRDVLLTDIAGKEAITIPELGLSMALSPTSDVKKTVKVRGVRIRGAQLDVTRQADGSFAFGLGGLTMGQNTDKPFSIDDLFDEDGRSTLPGISLSDVQVAYRDEQRDVAFMAHGSTVIFNPDGIVSLVGTLDTGEGEPIALDLTASRARQSIYNVDVRFAHVDPPILATLDPALEPIKDVRMILNGTAQATMTSEGTLMSLTADIGTSDGGQVVIDGQPRTLKKLSAAITYTPKTLHANIREIAFEEAGLSVSGRAMVHRDAQDRWSVTAQAPAVRYTDYASGASIVSSQTAVSAQIADGRLILDNLKTTAPIIRLPREKIVAKLASLTLSGLVDPDAGRINLENVVANGIDAALDGASLKVKRLTGSLRGKGNAASLHKGALDDFTWDIATEIPAIAYADKSNEARITAGQTMLAARFANGWLTIDDLKVAGSDIQSPHDNIRAMVASLAVSGTVDPTKGRIDLATVRAQSINATLDGAPLRIKGMVGSLHQERNGGDWTATAQAPALSYTHPANGAAITTGHTKITVRLAHGRLVIDDLGATASSIHFPRDEIFARVASIGVAGTIDREASRIDLTTFVVQGIDAHLDGTPIQAATLSGSASIIGELASLNSIRLDGVALHSDDINLDLGMAMVDGKINLASGFTSIDSLSLASLHAAMPEGNLVVIDELTATAQIDTKSGWARVVDLRAPLARVRLPKLYDTPLMIKSIDLDLDRNGASVAIPRFTAQIDGLPVTMKAALETIGEDKRARIDLTTGATSFEHIPRLWPKGVAPGGFKWVSKNVLAGTVSGLVLKARIDTANPDDDALALTFDFTDAIATAVRGLPPIRRGRGRGQVTLDRIDVYLDDGHVDVPQTPGFALGKSRFTIPDFQPRVPEGQIALDVNGPVGAILRFLDHEPLALISKSGLDMDTASGDASGTLQVKLPLSSDLDIEDVDFLANADIRDFSLSEPHTEMTITGDTMTVAIAPDGLTFRSDARVDGLSARVEYKQAFSKPATGEPEGVLTLQSYLTREDFALRAGVDISDYFDGVAVIDAKVDLFTGGGTRFAANTDLTGSTLRIDRLGWTKTDGVPVTVSVAGFRNPDGAGQIEKILLRGPGMSAAGRIGFDAGGTVRLIDFDRIILTDLMDVGVSFHKGGDTDARRIEVAGAFLDLRRPFSDAVNANTKDKKKSPSGKGRITEITTRLALVKLRDDLDIANLGGGLRFQGDQLDAARINGQFNSIAPAQLLAKRRGDGLAIHLTSPDAGAFLQAASVFEGATGGQLRLDAHTRDSELQTHIAGVARVNGITIRNSQTMREIFSGGAIGSLTQQMLSGSGLSFTKVELPFSGIAGRWSIQDGLAWGNALGLTLDGTYDIESKGIDLAGTVSPAYAINGALGAVPLLGTFLTGGEGEGVFGVTYAVRGTTETPDVWVNPLSAIAPGFLRKIVSGVMDGRGVASTTPSRSPSVAGVDR